MLFYALLAIALTLDLNVVSPIVRSLMQSVIKMGVGLVVILTSQLMTQCSICTKLDSHISSGIIALEEESLQNILIATKALAPSSLWSCTLVLQKSDNILVSILYDLLGVRFISNTRVKSLDLQGNIVITCIENIHWKSELVREYETKQFKTYHIQNQHVTEYDMVHDGYDSPCD